MLIEPIGKIENNFDTKFAVPRQSGLANEIKSRITFYDKYSNKSAFKGINGFSHLWIIWEFSENKKKCTSLSVRPPRLGGNEKVGVFASRSPFRPNNLGLSSVKLEKVIIDNKDKVSLIVSGADLISGTPIYDIKPYIKFSDCHKDAISGYADDKKDYELNVIIPYEISNKFQADILQQLISILKEDPRPSYHKDGRIYGFSFAGKEIKFIVEKSELTVLEIDDE